MAFLSIDEAKRMGKELITREHDFGRFLFTYAKNIDSLDSIDIFLSHSNLDKEIILGVLEVLWGMGYSVYVDWLYHATNVDTTIGAITPTTVIELKYHMRKCAWMIYLHSDASSVSKWCPWELGYFDAMYHPHKKICIFPLVDHTGVFRGQEYLALYREVDIVSRDRTKKVLLNENINYEKRLGIK